MTRIRLNDLRLDFQPPECLFEERITEIMLQISDGQALEPITVRFDGNAYYIQDGFHRVEAARRCGLSEIDAEILSGTLQEMEQQFRTMLKSSLAKLRSHKRTARK